MGAFQSEEESEDHPSVGDPYLIAEIRAGDSGAFELLYRRHSGVARSVAMAQADNASDAEDIVSEAFAAVFASLKDGKGPDEFFRAYLLTVVRRMAYLRNRNANRTVPGHDGDLDTVVEDADPVVSAFESTTMAKAFRTLPERWQAVLWYMDVEQMKPAAAAGLIGISPNGCSSLLIRAREALRQAYLQHHINLPGNDPCAGYAQQLARYARKKLNRAAVARLEAHLGRCAKCTEMLADLTDIQSTMRTAILPLLTGLAVESARRAGVIPVAPAPAAVTGALPWTVAGALKTAAAVVVLGGAALTATIALSTTGEAAPDAAPASASHTARSYQSGPADTGAGHPLPSLTRTPVPTVPAAPEPGATVPEQPVEAPPASLPPARLAPRPGPGSAATATAPASIPAPLPLSTSSPGNTPAPTPETTSPPVSPTPAGPVALDFSMDDGAAASQKGLRVLFDLRDDYTPASAEVVFRVSSEIQFIPWKVQAPEGWSCVEDPDGMRISCSTDDAPASDLTFELGISGLDSSEHATLYSLFTGDGQTAGEFRNSFP